MSLTSLLADDAPTVAAPDGSAVRVLAATARGSTALFTLPPHAIAHAVAHRTVEEIWYVLAGTGRLWRRLGATEDVAELRPGLSVTLPVGTMFQFRCDGTAPLVVFGVTMPPWPGAEEAYPVSGPWTPSV